MSHPYMPLYVADYLSATEHLGAAESGAYLHLIMHYWQKGSLPSNDVFLARIARMTGREWARHKPVIKAFFNDDWTHERIDQLLLVASEKSMLRSAAGQRGGIAKSLKQKDSYVANATILPEQTPSKQGSKSLPSSSGLGLERERKNSDATASEHARAEKFEEFWKVWPNKVGKPAARKSFDQISRQANGSWEALFDSIIEGVGRYSREKPPDRSWLNPATFLNQRRWDDQPAPVSAPRGSAREKRDPFGKIIENAWREKNGLPTVDESARIFGPEPNASDPLEPFSLQP